MKVNSGHYSKQITLNLHFIAASHPEQYLVDSGKEKGLGDIGKDESINYGIY